MGPFWFKPDHQPKPDTSVEFQLKPLDLRGAYECQATMHESGALSWDSLRAIFARNVLDWKGIDQPCNAHNRSAALSTSDEIFGFALRDWMLWMAQLGRHVYVQSILTEDERKNS